MSNFKKGDLVVFTGDIRKIASIWRPAILRMANEPVVVEAVYDETNNARVKMNFKEAPSDHPLIDQKHLSLYGEIVDEATLTALLWE